MDKRCTKDYCKEVILDLKSVVSIAKYFLGVGKKKGWTMWVCLHVYSLLCTLPSVSSN